MRIRITGKKNTKVDPELLRLATRYFMSRLLGDKSKNISVNLKIVPRSEDMGVFIFPEDKDASYEIELDGRMNRRKMINTLAHECVHVKQWHLREMRDLKKGNKVRWLGKLTEWVEPNLDTYQEYFDQPWEIEANGRAVGLCAGFFYVYGSLMRR